MFLVPLSRPGSELARHFDRHFDRLFDDTFERILAPSAETTGRRSPALDVAESERAYTVTLDLPGVAKEDVHVAIDGRRVSITAEARREDEKKDGDRIVYRERAVASYARSFTLPLEVDQADAQARLDQGVLTLTLPKRGANVSQRIPVR
jgi:HSP20 family protein